MELHKKFFSTQKIFYYLLILSGISYLLLAILTDANGQGGDSFWHYFFARYSWKHPRLFFDHWAKPVFTLFASPFAQFGFTGIKIFNVLISLTACYFTFLTAQKLEIKYAFVLPVLFILAKTNLLVTLSGLTEPLFSMALILSIYLLVTDKNYHGILIISFLPFVRSEGLIIMCVVLVYLIFIKKIKFIPILFVGHLFYAIAGGFYCQDFLWVLNKIPYATLHSNYGKGTWDHFFIHMTFMIGPLLYFLLVAGVLSILFSWRNILTDKLYQKKAFLVYGIFIAFFVSHTTFWVFGIFNSFGLTRVFVCVMPLILIICLEGFQQITGYFSNLIVRTILILSIVALYWIMVFGNHPSTLCKKDFELSVSQNVVNLQLIPYLNQKFPGFKVYTSVIDINYFMGTDVFDVHEFGELKNLKPDFKIKNSEVVVWDDWASVVEEHVKQEELLSKKTLKQDTIFSYTDGGNKHEFVVFRVP